MRGPNTRLHGRIPQAVPCSAFRRVADSGRNPLRAGAVLARGFTFGASGLRGAVQATFCAPPKP